MKFLIKIVTINLKKMDELDLVSLTYSLNERTKNLVNNQLLSDVCFLVGDDKVKIYGHQQNLALGKLIYIGHFLFTIKFINF